MSPPSKKCSFNKCDIAPVFGVLGDVPTYCVRHRTSDMVRLSARKCAFKDCIVAPLSNYSDNTGAIYCHKHKLSSMIFILPKKPCKGANGGVTCGISPMYNIPGKEPEYCKLHSRINMVNVCNKAPLKVISAKKQNLMSISNLIN